MKTYTFHYKTYNFKTRKIEYEQEEISANSDSEASYIASEIVKQLQSDDTLVRVRYYFSDRFSFYIDIEKY